MHKKCMTTLFMFAALFIAVNANTARTCYTCSGINCLRTTHSATQQCSDPLDYCVTIFDKFNILRKGCSSEVPPELSNRCAGNRAECHKCNMDRCNNLGSAESLCLQCDSSKDTNCAKNPHAIVPTRCAAPTGLNSYCFVKYENSLTKRGCALAVAEQEQCYNDANCMLCLPGDMQGCNRIDFKSGTMRRKFGVPLPYGFSNLA